MTINVIFSLIAISLIYAGWFFFWKRSVLEEAIDRLFFIRDDFRNYYVKNGITPDTNGYRNMRDLLNGFIKFVDEISIYTILYMKFILRNEEKLKETISLKDSDFVDENVGEEYIFQIRENALNVISLYLIKSTIFLYLPYKVLKLLGGFKEAKEKFKDSLDLNPDGSIEKIIKKEVLLKIA